MSNFHFGLVNSALRRLGYRGQPSWETESRAQDVLSQEEPLESVALLGSETQRRRMR